MVITKDQFREFEKHYVTEVLKNPDYRYGQAFLNYFLPLSHILLKSGIEGENDDQRLWNCNNKTEALAIIKKWVEYIDET